MQTDRIAANEGRLATVFLSRFNVEPTLAELINDPLIQTIMAADHVKRPDLESLLQQKRAQLAIWPR